MSLFVGARIIFALSQWAIIAGLSKVAGLSLVGAYGAALAVVTPIFTLAAMGMRQAAATDIRHEFSTSVYLTARLISGVVAILMTAGVGLILFGPTLTYWICLALAPVKFMEATAELRYGLLQKHDRHGAIAVSMIVRSLANIGCILAGYALTGSIITALLINAAAVLAVSLALEGPLLRKLTATEPKLAWQARLGQAARLIRQCFPLGVSAFLITSLHALPRLVVERMLGLEAAGVFTVFSMTFQAVANLVQVAGVSAITRIARDFHSTARKQTAGLVLKISGALILLNIVGTLAATPISKPLIGLVFSAPISEAWALFIALSLASSFRYAGEIARLPVSAARRFGLQVKIDLALLAAAVPSTLGLTAQYGSWGAAMATGATGLVFYVSYAVATARLARSVA
jgi:O-antigen/teichoic acid export membrane protein